MSRCQQKRFYDPNALGTLNRPFALVTLCILPVMVSSSQTNSSFCPASSHFCVHFSLFSRQAAAGELEQQMYREAMGTENNNDSNNKNNELDFNSPGGIVMESLSNIRTVASLALEDDRMTAYNNAIEKENPHATRNSFSKGEKFAIF